MYFGKFENCNKLFDFWMELYIKFFVIKILWRSFLFYDEIFLMFVKIRNMK